MSVAHVARQKGRPSKACASGQAQGRGRFKCARLPLYKQKRVEDVEIMARKGMVPWLRLCVQRFELESKKGHEPGASE